MEENLPFWYQFFYRWKALPVCFIYLYIGLFFHLSLQCFFSIASFLLHFYCSCRPDSTAGGCPGRGPPCRPKNQQHFGKKGNFFDLWWTLLFPIAHRTETAWPLPCSQPSAWASGPLTAEMADSRGSHIVLQEDEYGPPGVSCGDCAPPDSAPPRQGRSWTLPRQESAPFLP